MVGEARRRTQVCTYLVVDDRMNMNKESIVMRSVHELQVSCSKVIKIQVMVWARRNDKGSSSWTTPQCVMVLQDGLQWS